MSCLLHECEHSVSCLLHECEHSVSCLLHGCEHNVSCLLHECEHNVSCLLHECEHSVSCLLLCKCETDQGKAVAWQAITWWSESSHLPGAGTAPVDGPPKTPAYITQTSNQVKLIRNSHREREKDRDT